MPLLALFRYKYAYISPPIKGKSMSYAIESFDPEIFQAIENERERQTDHKDRQITLR